MNKKEAEAKLLEKETESKKKWCPLSRCRCNTLCVVYHKPYVAEIDDNEWTVSGGYCAAYILMGNP